MYLTMLPDRNPLLTTLSRTAMPKQPIKYTAIFGSHKGFCPRRTMPTSDSGVHAAMYKLRRSCSDQLPWTNVSRGWGAENSPIYPHHSDRGESSIWCYNLQKNAARSWRQRGGILSEKAAWEREVSPIMRSPFRQRVGILIIKLYSSERVS